MTIFAQKESAIRIVKKILIALAFIVAMAPVAAYVALQVPAMQTWAAGRAARVLSARLDTDVSIGKVYYLFFNKLILKDVHVMYTPQDTLISCKKLSVSISAGDLIRSSRLTLNKVHLYDGVFNLVSETDSTTNLARVFKLGKNEPKDTTTPPFSFFAGELKLDNFRFTLQNPFPGIKTKEGIINFTDLSLSNINAHIRGIEVIEDTLVADIRNITFNERSGFRMEEVKGSLRLSAKEARVDNLLARDRYSVLQANRFSLYYERPADFAKFTERVRMEADFNNSYLNFSTLARLAPALARNRLGMHISGLVSGTVSNLRSDNLKITSESGLTYLDLKAKISGLPKAAETMAFVDITYCTTTTSDLAYIISSLNSSRPIKFLTQLSPFVKYNFKGRLAGLLDDFVANGKLQTNIGEMYMDVLLRENTQKGGLHLEGNLTADKFNVGTLINNKTLGEVSFNSNMTALLRDTKRGGSEFYIDSITVKQLEFRDYSYSNIQATGSYVGEKFDGKIICHDPNLDFLFQGVFGMSSKSDSYYDFYADIMFADLAKLNLDKRDSVSLVSLRTTANFTQKLNGEILGNIQVRGLDYTNSNGEFPIGDIFINSASSREMYDVTLRSQFADMRYRGSHFLTRFADRIAMAAAFRHLPLLRNESSKDEENYGKENYSFTLNLNDTRAVSQLLLPGFFISQGSSVKINIDQNQKMTAGFSAGVVGYLKNYATSIKMTGESAERGIDLKFNSEKVRFAGLDLENTVLDLFAKDDRIEMKASFSNKTKLRNSLSFSSSAEISRNPAGKGPLFNITINPSELYFNDSKWNFAKSSFAVSDSLFDIKSVRIYNNNQSLEATGRVSPDQRDSLKVRLTNLDISPLNYFNKKDFGIAGNFTGLAILTRLYSDPRIIMNLRGSNVRANKTDVGELELFSEWDNREERFNILAENTISGENPAKISGTYTPRSNYLDLKAHLDKFAVSYFEPFLNDIVNNSSGTISGNLSLKGTTDKLVLSGEPGRLNDVGFTVLFTKVPYTLNGPYVIEDGELKVLNAILKDRTGNTGRVTGGLGFKYFKTITLNTRVDFTNLECINTAEKDNPNFYGKAFGTGSISITGPLQKILMDISVTTNRNTSIHIPLPTTSEASRTNLLSFKEPPKPVENEYYNELGYIVPQKAEKPKLTTELDVKLKTRVNTDAEMLIEIDKSVGDVIRSFGNGLVNIEVNPSKEIFSVHGDYIIDRGSYTFVLQGIFKRDFDILQGGNLNFNGDILKTNLNLTAVYNTKAAVNTLIADTSSVSNRRNVECSIAMLGELLNPRLSFGIEIPDIDPATKARVDAALNTEDKVIKQVMSLLVSGSFIPDIQSSIVNNSTILYSNATEVLSNQINNIFNQLEIPLDFSFNYQPGQNGRDIFDAAVSAQLFDNRVIVNGNIGSAKYLNQGSDVVGDVDVEVKLDEKGRFRAKAFSHSADQYSNYLDNSQRSGLGLVYQEEFSSFRELLNSIFMSRRKRERLEAERLEKAKKMQEKADSLPAQSKSR